MDPDAALKAVALRVNRAGSVAEEGTRESLEYSTIDVTNARRLIVEFQTALVSAYRDSPGSGFGDRNNGR